MELAVESLEENWNEMIRLAVDHWHETEMYRHGQKFAPSYDRYVQYEKAGCLFMCIARDKGEMVGYAIMFVMPSMHTQKVIATEDTYFLLPSHRKGRNALNLLKFAEDECRKRGAVEVMMTAKLTNNAGRILELRGYKEVAKQYSKQFSADSVQTTSNL
jgi:GNAT superfamily N-acetyltransferase